MQTPYILPNVITCICRKPPSRNYSILGPATTALRFATNVFVRTGTTCTFLRRCRFKDADLFRSLSLSASLFVERNDAVLRNVAMALELYVGHLGTTFVITIMSIASEATS